MHDALIAPPNLSAEQPVFSTEEQVVLLRILGITGDPNCDSVRAKAMAALTNALMDPIRTLEIIGALEKEIRWAPNPMTRDHLPREHA